MRKSCGQNQVDLQKHQVVSQNSKESSGLKLSKQLQPQASGPLATQAPPLSIPSHRSSGMCMEGTVLGLCPGKMDDAKQPTLASPSHGTSSARQSLLAQVWQTHKPLGHLADLVPRPGLLSSSRIILSCSEDS